MEKKITMSTINQPMHGKICMITGATDGIGKVSAHALAKQGATVIVVGRNRPKSITTVSEIRQESGNANVEYMLADLSSQQAIRELAEQFTSKYQQLHVLLNNAGAIFMSRKESVDDIEMTFALNHLNYFLLTHLLLDTIKASVPARIVNVSSGAHRRLKTLDFDNLQGTQSYSGISAYMISKLGNVLFTYELAKRLKESQITVNALHPGVVASQFGGNNGGWFGRVLRRVANLFCISVEEGAKTNIYLASSPEVEGVTGKYFVECKAVTSSKISYDEGAARRLWKVSEALTGIEVMA